MNEDGAPLPRAVLFDFYGTLARWRDRDLSNYVTVLAAHGYDLPPAVLDDYFARYDGIEHVEHSVDEQAYEAWVRQRLGDLTVACGVGRHDLDVVLDALRASDRGPMDAYPDAAPALRALRRAGLTIGVCSNWGWELDAFLGQVGLLTLVDVAVTSARAGARKPHPRIYAHTSAALGVRPDEVVFVGDSWGPDVQGPRQAGMTAVHLWREDERSGQTAPDLGDGAYRINDLAGLLAILGVS